MPMPIRELSVSVDDFELCAYWRLGRICAQVLLINNDHVRLQIVKACEPNRLFKERNALGLVNEVDQLSKALACRRTSFAGTRWDKPLSISSARRDAFEFKAQSEFIAVKGKPVSPNLHSQLNWFQVKGGGPVTNSFLGWQWR